ncbi:MAG: AraC family ligand binding domain-containing protein, partial [Lachnospiraceae bacterium]
MAYESITLQQEIQIDQIVSIHYFEYMSDFTFGGESHDFWEFLCVDKGVINVIADAKTYTLQKGDIIFHKPNEFHNVLANGIIAPNLVVIGFECSSDRMDFFRDKILQIGEAERSLLGLLIKEAHNTFASGLDDPYCEKLIRKEITPFGSEQFIKMYLQEILLRLIRTYSAEHVRMVLPKSTKQRSEDELFHKVISYMEENLSKHLTIEQICRDNLMGRSILQKLFREHTEYSVIDYFSSMTI